MIFTAVHDVASLEHTKKGGVECKLYPLSADKGIRTGIIKISSRDSKPPKKTLGKIVCILS